MVDRRERIQARAAALAGAQSQDAVRVARAAADESTATGPVVGEVWLYGVVGGYWWGFSSDSVAHALRQLGNVDEIVVRLDSPGGVATQGLSIANLLANHDAKVTVVVDGLAASAASQIALAGDEVVMSPGSQLMLHDAWMVAVGNASDLHSDADWLDKQSQNYAETYAHRAGGTAEQWRDVMKTDNGRGTWYTAQEAVEAGLADRVANIASTGTPPPEPEPDDGDDAAEARAAFDLDALMHPAARAAWTLQHPGVRRPADEPPKPPSASAVGSTHTEGTESAVAFSDEQMKTMRAQLGIAGDADEATIVAALSEALDERAEQPAPAAQSALPEGHVAIPAGKLADLEAAATQARSTAKSLHDKERASFLDSVRDKHLPTSRSSWEAEYDRDEAGVRAHFETAAVLIPLSEAGHAGSEPAGDALNVDDAALEAFASQMGLSKEALRG